jgi:hypothetical protein
MKKKERKEYDQILLKKIVRKDDTFTFCVHIDQVIDGDSGLIIGVTDRIAQQ